MLRVDPIRKAGEFLGDETDWKPIKIRHDETQRDFILADDEWKWLSGAWQEATRRSLRMPVFTLMCELMKLLHSGLGRVGGDGASANPQPGPTG